MGVEVAVCGASDDEHEAIRRLFEEWDGIFSRSRPGSELNRVNRDRSPVVVLSRPFAHALRTALRAAAATDGLFDPTLGAAPGRWRELRLSDRLLSRPPGVVLDLDGVVKSLAVDAAVELMSTDGFVAAGGDLAARGSAIVGLRGDGALRLQSGGIATSGTMKRRGRRGGAVHRHLIDPRSGRPADSRWDEVTVAAGSCLGADTAAKAAFLLSQDGPDWLDERGLPGRFRTGDRVVVNQTWRESLGELVAA
jgi:thiamine biosynthesis lipoprotein